MENLRKIWEIWKKVGQFIGDFIARIVLTIFYFTLFLPFGLGVRLLGDPLSIHTDKKHLRWLDRKTHNLTMDDARRLF
jgi:hypothetical protein